MKKTWLTTSLLSLGLGLAAVGCGDDTDDDDKEVKIQAPGVEVKADKLEGAAGAAAVSSKSE